MSGETQRGAAPAKGDEVDLAKLLLPLWRGRFWILAGAVAAAAFGVVAAFLASPVFVTQAIIAVKESDKGGDASRMLSQFGGMGGLLASNLGMGSTSLEKLEIIIRGHELAEAVITRNNLMPDLFPRAWNPKDSAWIEKDPAKVPTLRRGIDQLRTRVLTVSLDPKKKIIRIGARIHDAALAVRLVDLYIQALRDKIRGDMIVESERNREYLEKQLTFTTDPIIVEKIRNMIAFEIEKVMLASSQSIEILEKPLPPLNRDSPKRKKMVLLAFLAGLFLSSLAVLAWNGLSALRRGLDLQGRVPKGAST